MKSASRIVSVATITVLILFLLSCGGSGTTGSPAPIGDTYTAISGVAQKGPLQLGSLVTLQEMDKDLSPTGTQYTYQINSNLGTFSPTNKYSKKYIDIFATGYYFDEVTNRISTGPINLNGISDLSEHQILNVNLLTTLAYQRVQMLVNNYGLSISAARTQAENEVLAALNIPNGSEYGAFDSLDLAKGRAGDYILAAISSIFAVGNNAGDLSSLIANFQFDIAETGVITDTALKNALAISAKTINLSEVATNLNSKYARSGITYTAADLSNWVDQDGDGV